MTSKSWTLLFIPLQKAVTELHTTTSALLETKDQLPQAKQEIMRLKGSTGTVTGKLAHSYLNECTLLPAYHGDIAQLSILVGQL